MINIRKNVDLSMHTSFKIGRRAKYFTAVKTKEDVLEAIAWSRKNDKGIFVLGGGSNMLLTGDIDALVIKNKIFGSAIIKETKNKAFVTANSGEDWTEFVDFCISHELYGLENLYLIPGTVGAAPVQNIGAYGVEAKDSLYNLVAIDLKTGKEKIFKASDCDFGYRQSIFKGKLKGKYFIYQVTFLLSKIPSLKLEYGNIKEEMSKLKKGEIKASDVAKVVASIRRSKLPDTDVLPSAGSFFKNPEISKSAFAKLQKEFSDIKGFPVGDKIKVPAGWLIEKAGFKGKKLGKAGVYEKQALIIVSFGGKGSKDVLRLVEKIKRTVYDMFKIRLEEEVNII